MATRFEMEAILDATNRGGGAIAEMSGELAGLASELDRLDGRDVTVDVRADVARAVADLREAQRYAERLDNVRVTLGVDADTSLAEAALKDVERAAERVDGFRARIRAEADTDRAMADLRDVEAAARRIDASRPEVSVRSNSRGALAGLVAVERFVERLDRLTVEVTVRAVVTAALAGLRAVESLASRVGKLDPRVEVRVDASRAAAALRVVEALARRLDRLSPVIDVRAETRRATGPLGAVEAMSRRVDRLDPNVVVRADVRRATTPLANIERITRRVDRLDPTITARADTRRAETDLSRFGRVASDTGEDVAGLAASIGTRGAAISAGVGSKGAIALVPAVALLTASISPATAGLALGATAVGALAAGAGLAAVPLLRVSSRLADIREEGKKVPPELRRLDSALDDIKKSANQAFAGADKEAALFGAEVLNLSRRAMPQLGQASEQSMKRVRAEFDQAANTISPRQKQSFTGILESLPGIIGDGTSAALKFGKGFLNIVAQMMPRIEEFWDWVDKIAGDFLKWSESDKGREQIKDWIDSAIPVVRALGTFIQHVGGDLVKLGTEHADTVAEGIDGLTVVVKGLIWFFDELLDEIALVGDAFDAVFDAAGRAASAVGNFLRRDAPGGGSGSGGGGSQLTTRAYGGTERMALGGTVPVWRAAEGLTVPHYVTGPAYMGFPDRDVLYGEALSGGNREYAFPDSDSTTFITEEPGYDSASYGLWKDLGERKGFLGNRGGGADAAALLVEQNALLREQNELAREQIDETRKVSPRLKKDTDHILEHDSDTRRSAERGRQRVFLADRFGGR